MIRRHGEMVGADILGGFLPRQSGHGQSLPNHEDKRYPKHYHYFPTSIQCAGATYFLMSAHFFNMQRRTAARKKIMSSPALNVTRSTATKGPIETDTPLATACPIVQGATSKATPLAIACSNINIINIQIGIIPLHPQSNALAFLPHEWEHPFLSREGTAPTGYNPEQSPQQRK